MKYRIIALVYGFCFLASLTLMVGKFVLLNELAGEGVEVRYTDETINALREENIQINQKIASASSLPVIREKALARGFVEATKQQFLTMTEDQFRVAILEQR